MFVKYKEKIFNLSEYRLIEMLSNDVNKTYDLYFKNAMTCEVLHLSSISEMHTAFEIICDFLSGDCQYLDLDDFLHGLKVQNEIAETGK